MTVQHNVTKTHINIETEEIQLDKLTQTELVIEFEPVLSTNLTEVDLGIEYGLPLSTNLTFTGFNVETLDLGIGKQLTSTLLMLEWLELPPKYSVRIV